MRFVVIIGLALSLLVLGEGALQNWKKIEIPKMPDVSQKKKTSAAPERQNLAVNPQVPVLMPDLNTGYLFNAQRSITEQEGEEAASDESDVQGQSQVNMESLVYAGSIIIGDLRKGMVSFSLQEEAPTPTAPRRRGSPMVRRPAPKADMQYATVDEGDDFYGFKVASVQPDRIIFSKNGTNVEKMLYDPDKERTVAAAPNRPASGGVQAGANPPNVGGGTVPLPRQIGPAGQRARLNPATVHTAEPGRAPVVIAPSTPPVTPTPRLRSTVRRPQVIQRRRLPVQTR